MTSWLEPNHQTHPKRLSRRTFHIRSLDSVEQHPRPLSTAAEYAHAIAKVNLNVPARPDSRERLPRK